MIALLGWFEALSFFIGVFLTQFRFQSHFFPWRSPIYWHSRCFLYHTCTIISSFQKWRDKSGHSFAFLQVCGQHMSWGTWLDNGDLQREMCLDEWLFFSFLNRLGGSLFGFLRMLPTLCHSVPCSSWNLRQTFHGALSTLEDQSEEWTDTTEYNEVTLNFVGQIHDISVAAVHHGKCFCCIRSFSVAFFTKKKFFLFPPRPVCSWRILCPSL